MKVSIEYECGEKTCAVEPGKFCRFLGTRSFGTKSVCLLYRDPYDGGEVSLFYVDGWLQRCNQCLSQEEVK